MNQILSEGIREHNTYYMVEEKKIELFGCERRPDSVIKELSTDQSSKKYVYIVEMKKPPQSVEDERLEAHLKQNFQQLRHTCILKKQDKILGILTNYREWIFT